MKNNIIFLCILFGILMMCFLTSCKNANNGNEIEYIDLFVTPDQALLSPSGNYEAVIEKFDNDGVRSYSLFIIDADNGVDLKYEADLIFRARDKNFIFWADEEDILWAYNSDVGVYFWVNDNGIWTKKSYVDNRTEKVPQILRELRPRVFNN